MAPEHSRTTPAPLSLATALLALRGRVLGRVAARDCRFPCSPFRRRFRKWDDDTTIRQMLSSEYPAACAAFFQLIWSMHRRKDRFRVRSLHPGVAFPCRRAKKSNHTSHSSRHTCLGGCVCISFILATMFRILKRGIRTHANILCLIAAGFAHFVDFVCSGFDEIAHV